MDKILDVNTLITQTKTLILILSRKKRNLFKRAHDQTENKSKYLCFDLTVSKCFFNQCIILN